MSLSRFRLQSEKWHMEYCHHNEIHHLAFMSTAVSFMHPTHHIEPLPAHLATDGCRISMYSRAKAVTVHATECYVSCKTRGTC